MAVTAEHHGWRVGEKSSSVRGAVEKSPSDGSRNAHASKTTKRGAAGFGVVFTTRKTGPTPEEKCRKSLQKGCPILAAFAAARVGISTFRSSKYNPRPSRAYGEPLRLGWDTGPIEIEYCAVDLPPRTRFFTSCVAAFQGGGCRAAALVGAVEEAVSRGVSFVEFAGTSAGSIVAALMGAGASVADLKSIVSAIDFDKLFLAEPEDLGDTAIELPLRVRCLMPVLRFTGHQKYRSAVDQLGLHSSREIETWIDGQLRKLLGLEHEILFSDLIFPTWIVATDIPSKDVKIWSKLLTPGDRVAFAVRASCSIPGYFQPVVKRFVDGGVLSNLPTFVYGSWRTVPPLSTRVLGFALKAQSPVSDRENAFHLAKGLVDTVVDGATEVQLRTQPDVHVISIPTGEVSATDIKKIKTKGVVDTLIENGKTAANKFFEEELVLFRSKERPDPLCRDSSEMYSAIVENLDGAVKDVLVSSLDASWIYKLFPALLYWTSKRIRVRVLLPTVSSDANEETYRRGLLRSMGALVCEISRSAPLAFVFDGNDATRASAVVGIAGPDERKEAFAIRYSAPYDSATISSLYQQLSQMVSGEARVTAGPTLQRGDDAVLIPVLRKVKQYSDDQEVSLTPLDVPLDKLFALRPYVNVYKYRQAELLASLYGMKGIPLFASANVVFDNGFSSIAVPPVVEKSGDKYVLIEGTARAIFCLHQRRTLGDTLRCIVAEGVGERQPAGPPIRLRYVLPVARDPGISVDYKYFRHIERAAHPPEAIHENAK